jgi:UDP-GlcNAc:undecaprenyl-phosphate/decaprenyl-phosphate GlcNAc-1-phosphate transferase
MCAEAVSGHCDPGFLDVWGLRAFSMHVLLASDAELYGLRFFTWDQVLSPYMYVFYAAYLVAFIFTPILRAVAMHYQIIDEPDGARKMHAQPVAYLGGVAVFLGWLAGLALSQFLLLHRIEEGMQRHLAINFGIIIAACTIVLLGLWDDVLQMRPWQKILGQISAGAALVAFGVGKYSAWIFLQPVLQRTCIYLGWPFADPSSMQMALLYEHWIVHAASGIFVIAVVVGCCNATNLMDGLDGLCGGVTAVTAAGYLFLAVSLAASSGGINANQDGLRVVLGLALLGAVLAFVPYNFNPASIFMGDTGSMFIGFACGLMMILFASEGHSKWFLAAMVMFALPMLDTLLAFTRRWVNRRPLFSADKHHFHHQMVARGFSVKQTVLISYGLSLIFCILGGVIVYVRTRYAVGIYLVVFGSIIVAAYKMGMVHERVKAIVRKPLDASDGRSVAGEVEAGKVIDLVEREKVGVP